MLFNYFKIAIRNISRSATYPIINIAGLTLGITCAILIFSLVTYHLSFDTFHSNSERIYRFVTEQHRDEITYDGNVPPAFGNAFRNDYTYGEKVARLTTTTQLVTVDTNGDQKKFEESMAFADPEFFEIFNFPMATSHSSRLLTESNTAIVTEKLAKKYFGDESAIGKTIKVDNKIDFTIVGILKDIPDNTDFRSELYLSYVTMPQYNEWYAADDSWGGITTEVQTFALLQPGSDVVEIESKLTAYVKKFRPYSKNIHHYKLQSLGDVHFNPLYGGQMSISTIWILATIGLFLIITACLNFINLATAQAIRRAKEVGVRKSLGSAKSQLFWQFTLETGIIVTAATVLGLGTAWTIVPNMNELFAVRITIALTNLKLILFLAGLIATVTLLAGSYPGMVLSRFKPVQALKGKVVGSTGGFSLRRVLITSQFVITHILILGLIVVMTQMKYFREADMGFNKDGIVMIPIGPRPEKINTLKEQFRQIPGVLDVSGCFSAPASNQFWGTSVYFDRKTEQEAFGPSFKGADADYVKTFGLEIVAGRNLAPSDSSREFLVNETFVRKLNAGSAEDILGKILTSNGDDFKGPIVGVVSDFHDQSLKSAINPLYITTAPWTYNSYAVRIDMSKAATLLPELEKTWSGMYPDQIYTYQFLEDETARFYQAEELTLTLVETFSFIALFIGCLGLYGLVSFMAIQKTKEIGIRKVLGGSISQMLWIFAKEFVVLILIAFAIASPVAILLTSKWLELYEHKVPVTVWVFILELAIVSFVVLTTVGFRSIKAAMANPVNSLRTE